MRIYQFDNDFQSGAISYCNFGEEKDFKWSNNWKWLTDKKIVNTFSYKDDL